MGVFFNMKKIVCRIIGKCSGCGDTLTMSQKNTSLCISCEWAENKSSTNKENFNIIAEKGEKRKFTYSGYTRYSPNRSSRCGYGSDDWLYLCEEDSKYYLLMLSDDAGHGTVWMCTELLDGDFEKLINADVNFWVNIAYSKERTKIYGIRLTDIENVRHLLPTSSRCRKLTDEHYLR